MSLYTRALKHIDMDRVKELREEKIEKQKITEIKRQEEIISAELKKIYAERTKHYNWRRDLGEGMTTSAMMSATLPAEGDVNLGDVISPIQSLGSSPGFSQSGNTYTCGPANAGTPPEVEGGFIINIDTSKFDTLVFDLSPGTINSFEIVSFRGSQSSVYTLSPSAGRKVLSLRSVDRRKNAKFSFSFIKSNGDSIGTNVIRSLTFQRRTPMNVFVSLDSPEATAFIRTDPSIQGLSAEEKKKKLADMLDSGNEYLLKHLGITGSSAKPSDTTMPPSWEQFAQNSSMDIQVGDERITKVDGKTKTDTTRGIEDGKIDGKDFNTQPKPQSQSDSKKQTKELSFDDKIKGTWADPEFRSKEIADVKARAYDPNAPFAKGGVGDPVWMDQQAEKAIAKAKGETAKNISKPLPNVNDSDKAQLEKNIEASLKQLEIDNEQLKGDALKRNIGLAVDLGLDVLTVVTLLTPIPGDEAVVLSAQAAKAGVKTGAKTAAQKASIDAFRTQVTSPKTLDAASQAIKRAGSKYAKDVAIPIKVQGKTINVKANEILRNKGFQVNSYKPRGKYLSEKKSFKDITKKIPGYYDGKPAPLGFPMQEPPKMKNGYHPDLVTPEGQKKQSNRYNNLDPQSAKAMPPTGNPYIDKKVRAAAKK